MVYLIKIVIFHGKRLKLPEGSSPSENVAEHRGTYSCHRPHQITE